MRGLIPLGALLLTASLAVYTAPAPDSQIRPYLDRGLELGKEGKWNEAITELRKATTLAPQSAEVRYSLGVALFWTHQYSAARHELEQSLGIDPKLAAAHFFLGCSIEAGGGDLLQAAHHLEKAVEYGARAAEVYRRLGLTLTKLGDLGGAIHSYREALKTSPDALDIRNLLGLALIEAGDLNGAIAMFRQMLAANSSYLAAKKNLGLVLIRAGDSRAAETIYRELLAADPKDAVAQYNLGVALREQDKLEEAGVHFQKAIGLNPGWADPAIDWGKALWQLDRLDEARQALQSATVLEPGSEDAWRALSAVLVDLGDLSEAANALTNAIRVAPGSPEAHYSLALIYRRLGKLDEATRELDLAGSGRRRRDSADAAIVSTQTGIRLLERGEFEAAAGQFRAVIASEPGFAPAYYQLSLTLKKLGRERGAAEALKAAESRDPGLRFCRSSLGLRSWLQRNPVPAAGR